MFQIRIHGRGGQEVVSAAGMLSGGRLSRGHARLGLPELISRSALVRR